jgi:hypothetical protein
MIVTDEWNYNNTYGTASSWYTTSTAPSDSQTYYTIGPNGESTQINMPEHTHQTPADVSGNWNYGYGYDPSNTIIFRGVAGGEEIMRFKDELEIKVKDKWISVSDMMKRIDKLESIVENLYSMLPQWKIDMMGIDEDEEIDEEVDHIDPDLFKV